MKHDSVLQLVKFGEALSSRPEGREAALQAIAYQMQKQPQESVILDFEKVIIMTPSWLGEFIYTLKQHGVRHVKFQNTQNRSVTASIEIIEIEERARQGS